MNSPFIFVCTNPGSEKDLKEEMKRNHPSLHPSYSRPGLVTFKETGPTALCGPEVQLNLCLAHHYGITLFKCTREKLASSLREFLGDNHYKTGPTPPFFLWQRDEFSPAPALPFLGAVIPQQEWKIGANVLNILQVEEDDFLIGLHRHARPFTLHPRPMPFHHLPLEAPSRAYLKMKEALVFSRARLSSGEWALELGASPGGMSYCLLQQGVNVIGVDTGEMDPVCLAYDGVGKAEFVHLRFAAQKLIHDKIFGSDKPIWGQVRWLVMDINLHPQAALAMALEIKKKFHLDLKGAFFTLKLGREAGLRQIPQYLELIKTMGLSPAVVTQLPSNRSEIFVYATPQSAPT